MSNPTSNFGWQMPTPTDLVTDLPADFEVFGQAVDTSLADLRGGTTGQILSKTTNADMDFTWTNANPGDITGVTAGIGISGGGTSGDVTVTNSMATAIDAKGDLIVGTGADTFSKLSVGTNGYLLTADSAEATGMKWAAAAGGGGMTLLNSGNTSIAGAQSLTISSISGSYKHLYIVGLGLATTNNYGADVRMRINSNTGSNYKTSRYQVANNTITGEADKAPNTSWFLVETHQSTGYNQVGFFETSIPLYSATTQYKKAQTFSGCTQGGDVIQNQMCSSFNSTSAITDLEFFTSNSSTGNFVGDSAIYVYGVN